MPAPVVSGIISYLSARLSLTVWDGEVPRQDTSGNNITPNVSTTPTDWPVVKVTMPESGFQRNWNMGDPYDDLGTIDVTVYGTTRAQLEAPGTGMLVLIDDLLASEEGWRAASQYLGGDARNPFYFVSILLNNWYSVQEEGVRLQGNQLLYRGGLNYEVRVHGAVSTS